MGGSIGIGNKYANVYTDYPKVKAYRGRFDLLQLTEKDIGILYEHFVTADLAKKNVVSTRYLSSYCKLDKFPFAARMLSSFKKGQPFAGFVFEIWNICTTDERDLADLVYHLYDPSNVGHIEPNEARLMLNELLGDTGTGKDGGKKRSNELVQQLVGSSSSSSSFDIDFKAITKSDFQKFTRKQTTSLFLAFGIQKKIIEHLGGFAFWDMQSKKRSKMSVNEVTMISQVRADILTGRLRYDDDGYEATGGSGVSNGVSSGGGGGSGGGTTNVKDKSGMDGRQSRGGEGGKKDIITAHNTSQKRQHHHPQPALPHHPPSQSEKVNHKSDTDHKRKTSPSPSTDIKPHPTHSVSEKLPRNDPLHGISSTTTIMTMNISVTEKNRKKRLVEAHVVDKKALKAALAKGSKSLVDDEIEDVRDDGLKAMENIFVDAKDMNATHGLLAMFSRFQKKEKVGKSLDTLDDGKQENTSGLSVTPPISTTPTSPAATTIVKAPKSALKISTKSNQTLAHGVAHVKSILKIEKKRVPRSEKRVCFDVPELKDDDDKDDSGGGYEDVSRYQR